MTHPKYFFIPPSQIFGFASQEKIDQREQAHGRLLDKDFIRFITRNPSLPLSSATQMMGFGEHMLRISHVEGLPGQPQSISAGEPNTSSIEVELPDGPSHLKPGQQVAGLTYSVDPPSIFDN